MSKIEITGQTVVQPYPNPAGVDHLKGKWKASCPHILYNGISGIGDTPEGAVRDLISNLKALAGGLMKEANTLLSTKVPDSSDFNEKSKMVFTKALDTLGEAGHKVRPDSLSKKCWIQTWPSTACGFGGIAGQAFTDAETTVVNSSESDAIVVFHANKFAYLVENPTDKFREDVSNKQLDGAAHYQVDKYDKGPQHLDKNGKRIRVYYYVVFKTSEGITKHLEVSSLLKDGMLKLYGHDKLVQACEVKINNLDSA